ncbi:inositol polyphosphate 5-phosphatase [Mactra antiquata]
MDIKNDSNINSSLVSLTQKPPTKGRKKKSAVAKLAEKKRLGSEAGSECGSVTSLRKDDFGSQNINRSTSDVKQSSDNLNNKTETEKKGHNSNSKTNINVDSEASEKAKKNDHTVTDNSSPPKPVPRKSHRKSHSENNLDTFEGGTVVSIYDKREGKPPRRARRDPSPKSQNDINTSKSRKELFLADIDRTKDLFSVLGPVKPKPGLSPLGDLPPLDSDSNKVKNVELSPPVPMDIDGDLDEINDKDDSKDPNSINNNAPSDATVHRFRSMRMTPDRSRSEESLKNAQFTPKPPTTPRSARKTTPPKGEKRNREANSSGEEADIENKKQNSDSIGVSDNILNTSLSNLQPVDDTNMEVDKVTQNKKGLSMHPNVKEVKDDFVEMDTNQSMNIDSELAETSVEVKKSNTVGPIESHEDLTKKREIGSSPDSGQSDNSTKKSGKKKLGRKQRVKPITRKELAPLDGSDIGNLDKTPLDTIGSASDLKAINEQYKEVLMEESPVRLASTSRDASELESVIPEPKANSGKLSPIQPKSLPPPLPHDMKSTSLRTTYKTDPSYSMTKFFGRSFSGQTERERTQTINLSQRSLSMTTTLHAVPTREARDRMKQTSTGPALLSSSELDKYFPDRKVGLWVGSWNMAEIKDCKDPLDDFLLPEVCEYVQDIYAIGTQENAMNKKEWEILLQETIGPSHVLFHSASHGALHLAIFVKRDLIWFCTVPEDDLVQTRAVTMVKTKGAIAVSFQFFGTSFLFINCHFAPGDGKKKERLDDFTRIIKNLNLPKQQNTGSPNSNSNDVTTRFDCVFWMGDLNFRIEVYKGKEAVENIVNYIEQQEHTNFEGLLAGDQLSTLIVEGSIFQGFQEGRINFRPTYKYDIGKDTFDTSSKNRIPSYTDRVLFRAKKKNSITCTHYDSPSNVTLSDHRPVFAVFDVAIQPARECNLPLAAGQFDRSVYTEANRRRTLKVEVIKTFQKEKSSKVCSIQ